jgi:hypothetical protein
MTVIGLTMVSPRIVRRSAAASSVALPASPSTGGRQAEEAADGDGGEHHDRDDLKLDGDRPMGGNGRSGQRGDERVDAVGRRGTCPGGEPRPKTPPQRRVDDQDRDRADRDRDAIAGEDTRDE